MEKLLEETIFYLQVSLVFLRAKDGKIAMPYTPAENLEFAEAYLEAGMKCCNELPNLMKEYKNAVSKV